MPTYGYDINSTTPYVRPFDDDAITVSATFLLTMMVFGIFANLITIIVILKSRVLTSIFNFLIVSLCVSDLLSALISPLFLYRRTWGFDEWLMPGFLCKTFWAVDTWTSYVTALHILLFAVIRLVSIKWPLDYKKVKLLHIRIIAALIWFVTFCCGFIPRWIWYEAKTRNRHAPTVDAKWPACTLNTDWLIEYRLYYKIAFPVFIYFPMAAIAVLSPVIAGIILGHRSKRLVRKESMTPTKKPTVTKCERKTRKRENHAIVQLLFITGSFMFGYIPITAYTFYTTNTKSSTMSAKIYDWNFGMIAYILLRLSECLNPLFYNIASGKMRRETIAFLKGLCSWCPSVITGRVRTSSTSSNSSDTKSSSRSSRGTMDLTL